MARVNGKQLFVMKMIQNSRIRRSTLQKLLLYLQNRRLLLLRLCFVTVLLLSSRNNSTVRVLSSRRFPRNTGWFEHVWETYSDARFKKTFRVSKQTFLYILSKIEGNLLRQTLTEEPISPAFRLAMCLYKVLAAHAKKIKSRLKHTLS